mmetsp:Transcript_65257/g.165388  ORF Transcript_65257/g.165388 Transcript_65257/m.165388 type:complete len:209 (+) Transcript_65257:104-730(+)
MAGSDDSAARGKAAALRHDRFNLVFICPIIVLTVLSLLKRSDRQAGVHAALSWTTLGYIVADICYNALVPHCQPSKVRLGTILFHHLVTCWLVWHPIQHRADSGHITAYGTIVEVNTIFQTLHKVFRLKIFQQGFLATWVSMRLVWYPYCVWLTHLHMLTLDHLPGSYTYCQVVGSQFTLVCLNLFWSAEFLMGGKKKSGTSKTVKDK